MRIANNRLALLSLPIFTFAAAGCSSTSSTGLATSDIKASLYVTVNDDDPPSGDVRSDGGAADDAGTAGDGGAPDPTHGSFISADLEKDDSLTDGVNLDDNDSIYAATNLDPHTPMPRALAGFYDTSHLDLSQLTDVNFVLVRANGAAAPSNTVKVPAAIALTAPKVTDEVSLSSGKVTFTWSNPVAGARVYVLTGPCGAAGITASTKDISRDDTGTYDIAAADVIGGAPTAPGCYRARIVRTTKGTADPAWRKGSTVSAERNAWVEYTLKP